MKKPVDKKDFENYLSEAKSWETDKVREILKSCKAAWWVASASAAIAFVSVVAVASLTPLKQTEAFVIRVDNSTGIVDVVNSIKNGKTNYDEAMNKYFAQGYVRHREGYSNELAEEYYGNVGIMSVEAEQQKYYAWFNPKNPASPLAMYGEVAKVRVEFKGVSFIKPNVALVRYSKVVERGGDKSQVTHWAATIVFKYSGAPMTEKARAINPLGFQVVEYRNDPEALVQDVTKPDDAPIVVTPNNAPVTPQFAAPAQR